MNANDLDARLPVWTALSDLFLDTELDPRDYRHISGVIVESGYAAGEIERILWLEVFPALADNLRSVAGEWAGFDGDWLETRILAVTSGQARS